MLRALFVIVIVLGGCKKSEDESSILSTGDLSKLRIEPDGVDPNSSRVIGIAGVVPVEELIRVHDITAGLDGEGSAGEFGSFNVLVTGGRPDDVYSLQAAGDEEPLIVAQTESGTVAEAWGQGWSSTVGCVLDGWIGIIGENGGGEPIDHCVVSAQIQGGAAVVSGPIEPRVIGDDTTLRVRTFLVADGSGDVPDVQVILVEDTLGTEFVLRWTPEAAGAETHSLVLSEEEPALVGKTINAARVVSTAGSALVIADLALIGVSKPEF